MDKKNNLQSKIYNLKSRAFTLVELMIVVAILGILAAIVIPEFSGHIQQAKEAAAKDNLRILRETIERYAFDNNGIPPGYVGNNLAAPVTYPEFYLKLVNGGYLTDIPKNPFNNLKTILMVQDAGTFPESATGNYGWIYKAKTRNIRLDYPGTNSNGKNHFNY